VPQIDSRAYAAELPGRKRTNAQAAAELLDGAGAGSTQEVRYALRLSPGLAKLLTVCCRLW
jgi:hypothetical protein